MTSTGVLTGLLAPVLAMLLSAASGCDNREAFHELEPGLERMQLQPKVVPYASPMRRPPADTVVAHSGDDDRRFAEGRTDGGYVDRVPLAVTRALLTRGRDGFERVCATCHGILGDGVSVVADKMEMRRPPSLDEPRIRALAPGMVFTVVTHGYGLMPSYAQMLDVEDRWAIVLYVQALQLSGGARVSDLSATMHDELAREAP
jgi:mono/diheme cytochrome c family protein